MAISGQTTKLPLTDRYKCLDVQSSVLTANAAWTLHTAHCTPHAAHRTLYFTLRCANCSPKTENCKVHKACTLNTAN